MNSYAQTVLGVSITFSVVALALTAARVWARQVTKRRLQAHDWIVVVNSLINFAICVYLEWGAINTGIGKGREALTAEEAVAFRKLLWSGEIIITFIVGSVKIAVLLFYKQIFTTRKFGLVANVFIVLSALWTAIFVLLIVFKRFPVQNEWSLEAYVPHHWNAGAMWVGMGVTDVFLDLCILIMPFPVLSRLNVNRKRKILISGIILLGAFIVVASAVRLVYFVRVEPVFGEPYYNFSDSVTNVIIWSVVESSCSLIAANLPTLAPLFKQGQGLHKLFSASRSYAGYYLFGSSHRPNSGSKSRKSEPHLPMGMSAGQYEAPVDMVVLEEGRSQSLGAGDGLPKPAFMGSELSRETSRNTARPSTTPSRGDAHEPYQVV